MNYKKFFPAVTALFLTLAIPSLTYGDFYSCDQNESSVTFSLKHLGMIMVSGKFKNFRGDFFFQKNNISASGVQIAVETASVDSGLALRDQDLRSKNFFWAEKYPELTFVSKSILDVVGTRFKIYGDLTIKGITRPVIFETRLLDSSKGNGSLVFQTWTTIRRKDFNLGTKTWAHPIFFITNEELKIELNILGRPKNP